MSEVKLDLDEQDFAFGEPAAPALPELPPITEIRRFGGYHLLCKLAEGGMAELFLAKKVGAEGFERNLVIKRMREDLSRSKELVRMFLEEARLAARLFHPNIVQITDLGEAGGHHFICMEYLPGEDLGAIVERLSAKRERIPLALAARITLAVCEGLEFAHAYREEGRSIPIVHRDVSPSNVIVTYQGAVKLVDFGIAKAAPSSPQAKGTGRFAGKLGYMSPEQLRREPLDGRSDLFSLGATLFELLTGRKAFARESEYDVVMAVMEGPTPRASELRADVPPQLDALLARALARNPAERYPDARAMRTELEAFLAAQAPSSTADTAAFLQALFGRPRMERRTQIPTLAELAARGVSTVEPSPPAAAPAPGPAPAVVAVPAAPRPGARWLPPVFGAIAAVVLLAGGAGMVLLLRPAPPAVVAAPPAPVPPVQAVTPAAVAPTPPVAPPPPAVVAPPAKPTPPVELTPKLIAGVVSRSRERILSCFEQHRPDLGAAQDQGRVTLAITITQAGEVSEARVITPGFEGLSLSACVVRQVKALKFPRNTTRELTINVPFAYRVAE